MNDNDTIKITAEEAHAAPNPSQYSEPLWQRTDAPTQHRERRNSWIWIVAALLMILVLGSMAYYKLRFSPRLAIEQVLELNRHAERTTSSISEALAIERQINLSLCPVEFRIAFVDYLAALESSDAARKALVEFDGEHMSDNGLMNLAGESTVRWALGDPLLARFKELQDQRLSLERRQNQAIDQLHEAWHHVEREAVKDGATVPASTR